MAAWIRHASRAVVLRKGDESGERESNAWVTYPRDRDSRGKLRVIPDNVSGPKGAIPPGEGPAAD